MDKESIWKIINSQFEENSQSLVRHHIESYNDFYKTGIFQIFKEKNLITINSSYDENIKDYRHQCNLYLGGKNGDKIYFGKPVIYDNDKPHYMFPNEARLRNMTYAMTIHYDVDIEYIDILEDGEAPYTLDANMIRETGGGKRENRAMELEDTDYSEERAEAQSKLGGNFKERTLDMFQEKEMELLNKDPDEAPGVHDGFDADGKPYNEMRGGGPKKVERKKRFKSTEVEMTTDMAAKVRDAMEKTVINKNRQIRPDIIEKVYLGKFPIMVQSDYCILNGLPREVKYFVGECKNDNGGYFIIDGKEKTIIPQEKFGDNMLYIRHVNDEKFLYSAEIRSVSENSSKPIRTLSVKICAPSPKYTFENMVVNIPNVRNPVPLFIVFRALGILTDKAIISMCVLDIEKYESMLDLFIPSVHDAGGIMTQKMALMYIASLTKYNTVSYALEILSDFLLPHVGENNFIQKAYYLGYMVFRLLSVYTGIEQPTDRDNFKYKRVELVGSLIYDLFREYYTIQYREIHLGLEKILHFNQSIYSDNLQKLVMDKYREVFRERHVEIGFKKAYKGNWGSQTHTKRIGVVQDLNRLSFLSALSHLRKTNLPLDASAKVVGPRVLHGSQWGFIDPIDTPDGGNIGLHKSLAISTVVSRGYSREPMIKWLLEKVNMRLLEDCGPKMLSTMTRVLVNGMLAGAVDNPLETINKIRLFKRNSLIPIFTSATFEIKLNLIFIYTDAGRVCRPIFYRRDDDSDKMSFEDPAIMKKIKDNDFVWSDLVTGFNRKKIPGFQKDLPKIYELHELYEGIDSESNPARLERFLKGQAIIEYIDPSESENAYIAVKMEDIVNEKQKHTHLEIHESLIFGVMCNQIIFPENNPPTRDSFSCGQSKQAVSMYHTNFQVRMDKTAVVLNNGQVPLVKSRYMEHINHEENPYGENAIVAIMCYTGYNMEDSVLINEGAIKRGLFNTTYFTVYESHEENSKNESSHSDKRLTNIENQERVMGTKPGYDYSKLDKFGIIKENTPVDDKTVLIGMTISNSEAPGAMVDSSKTPKKGQLGVVDKSFITEGEEGSRIAKVRIREIRIPIFGDKMASRSGQKGTVGMVVPEENMPFTKDGLRPDIIINPHAIPTRMTIGQLVECIMGKSCAMYGGFGDCTAFNNDGSKIGVFGEHLSKLGFHSSGNEILYNGMTGEQIETSIFIGPTYYMRLKHMVKDKVNYRARGPNTALTKQPVSGRANDGGLRIGEMERDVLISHGISNFLRESMMERADKYYMAVCNQTGMLAVFNPSKNLFFSPMADGPVRFVGSVDGKDMYIDNISKFGRSFSVICVPYTFKLLMQELQCINVQMRIITEDNIGQLENLTFSKNISKLMHIENAGPKEVDEYIKQKKGIKPHSVNLEETMETARQTNEKSKRVTIAEEEFEPAPESYSEESGEIMGGNVADFDMHAGELYDMATQDHPSHINAGMQGGMYPEMPIKQEKEETNEFQKGETVFLRGGTKSNRQWTVKDNGGNEFITIETADLEGLEDIADSIKVVEPHEIYRPSDVVHANQMGYPGASLGQMMAQDMGYGQPEYPYMNSMIPPAGGMQPVAINPSFNIITGNDNKVETPEQPATPAMPMMGGFGGLSTPTQPTKISMGGNSTAQKSNKSADSVDFTDTSKVDFSKLVIKKLE